MDFEPILILILGVGIGGFAPAYPRAVGLAIDARGGFGDGAGDGLDEFIECLPVGAVDDAGFSEDEGGGGSVRHNWLSVSACAKLE